MTAVDSRQCPLCGYRAIPPYRALCRRCFDRVPWRMRADFLKAWRLRVLQPVVYAERLIELYGWNRDDQAQRKESRQ